MKRLKSRDQITFHLRGGLGNQLFIYAAGVVFSRNSGIPVVFSTKGIDHGHSIKEIVDADAKFRDNNFMDRALRKSGPLLRGLRMNNPVTLDYTFPIGFADSRVKLKAGSKYDVFGYFQNKSYVEAIDLDNFQIRKKSEFKNKWVSNQIEELQSKDSTIIHLRLGDYRDASQTIGLLDLKYYEEIVNCKQIRNEDTFIVSNDPVAAKEFFSQSRIMKPKIIFPPKTVSDIDMLEIFDGASTILTSNSTYSWWGALLSSGNPQVVIPDPWFRDPNLQIQVGTGLQRSEWESHKSIWRDS